MKFSGAIAGLVVVASIAISPPARAFHELECGPFRTTIINEATGARHCVETSPDAKDQFLRFRQLQQEQEKRVRDLQLRQSRRTKAQEFEQRQRANAQTQITIQERNRQRSFTRRQTQNQRRQSLAGERTQKIQDGLLRQGREAKRRNEQALESDLLRAQNLLEQRLELPRADLLDDQKALSRRVLKDQQSQ